MITPIDNCQKCNKLKSDLEEKIKEGEILKKKYSSFKISII